MGLLVVSPGHSTTVQDLGRTGYREWGVPVGGAFDAASAGLANALVGNPPGCATLEMTLFGGLYEATTPLAIALAGAPMAAAVVGRDGEVRPLSIPTSCPLEPGERLRVGGTSTGVRTYLAVQRGWQTRVVLGSRSSEDRLVAGTTLEAQPGTTAIRHPAGRGWADPAEGPIRVIDGPDAAQVADLDAWLGARFTVGREWDRMGLRMEGPPLSAKSPADRVSMPVAPGAIQVAGGRMLLLGVACGTMGGYLHVAQVISADLGRIGQVRAGHPLEFRRVGVAEARAIDRRERARRGELHRVLATIAGDAAGRSPAD